MKSRMRLRDEKEGVPAKYYVDNVLDAVTEPGDWYLDRGEGDLYYIPMPGEDMQSAQVHAPYADSLLRRADDTSSSWRSTGLSSGTRHYAGWRPPRLLRPPTRYQAPCS